MHVRTCRGIWARMEQENWKAEHEKSAPTNRITSTQLAPNGFHARRPATRALPPNCPVTGPVPDETPQHRPPFPFPVNHGPWL